MRPNKNNIDMVPSTGEVLSMIDAHQDLQRIDEIRRSIEFLLRIK